MRKVLSIIRENIFKILISLFVIGVVLLYNYSSLFNLKNISVYPIGKESFTNIQEAKANTLAQEYNDKKFFSVSTLEIQKRVYEISPYVDIVFVSKEFPNSLSILIGEKSPFIYLQISKESCVILDEDSFVLDNIKGICPKPNVIGVIQVNLDNSKIEFITRTVSNYNQLFIIKDTIKVLNEYGIPVLSVSISEDIVKYKSINKKEYIFSQNQSNEDQLARLVAVVTELEKKNYNYKTIDLRFKRPVLTIK